MDLIRWFAVNFPLGLRQRVKDLEREIFRRVRKSASFDHRPNIGPGTVRVVVLAVVVVVVVMMLLVMVVFFVVMVMFFLVVMFMQIHDEGFAGHSVRAFFAAAQVEVVGNELVKRFLDRRLRDPVHFAELDQSV